MNQVIIIGKITGDIINFVQTNGERTSKFKIQFEGAKQGQLPIDCVAWKSTAERIYEDVRSNDLVSLTGRLNHRTFMNGGVQTTGFEIIVDRINLIIPEYEITNFM